MLLDLFVTNKCLNICLDWGRGDNNQLFKNDFWSNSQQSALQQMEEKIRRISSRISDPLFSTEDLENSQPSNL